ncbi:hypothetical protein GKQ23_21330 [Erwinia sp. E602]|nr:hypothetical protein GKQ23_21330 [Erwinia sp. E602]
MELLGFSIEVIRTEYEIAVINELHQRNEMIKYYPEHYQSMGAKLSFDEFLTFIIQYNLSDFSNQYIDTDFRHDMKRTTSEIISEDLLEKIPCYVRSEDFSFSERSAFIGLMSFLHPYSIIRLLSEIKIITKKI